MSFNIFTFLAKQYPVMYKIWLENDGKPIPPEYFHFLNKRKPLGSQAFLWSSRDETNQLLEKYKDQFPIIHKLYWSPHTRPVSRSDILRLLIVFDRPCIYSDHDIEWSWRLPTIHQDVALWTEFVHTDEAVRKNMVMTREFRGETPEYNVRIANYVYWTRKPHSALIGRCLKNIQERLNRNSQFTLSDYGVLYTTAGDVLTDTVVEGLPASSILQPFEKCEHTNTSWTDTDGDQVLLFGRLPGRSIAKHEIHGQWRS